MLPRIYAKIEANSERFAGRPEPSCQDAHHLEREKRRLADQKQKLLFRDRDQLDIGLRHRGRAARRVVDQRHLAEDLIGRQFGQFAIARQDGDRAALDDIELVSLIALFENNLTRLERVGLNSIAGQHTKIDFRSRHALNRAPRDALFVAFDCHISNTAARVRHQRAV